jgi:hypothetical protein
MANTADPRVGLAAFLQKRSGATVKNTLFNIMPTLGFFFALNGDKEGADGLGRPKDNVFSTGVATARARREKIMAERWYMPVIQTTAAAKSDVKSMSDYDTDPTVASWATTGAPLSRITQPVFKFARFKMPYIIPHSEVRTAKAGMGSAEAQAAAAIRSVYELEIKDRNAQLCDVANDNLWGINTSSAGVPTDQTVTTWDHLFSIQQAIHDSNNYGGVDRSISGNAYWRGHRVTASNTMSFYDRIDYCNYTLGLADKGLGVQLIIVGKAQFIKAKQEAKAESYQLFTGSIPEFAEFGFRREVVKINSGNQPVYILYDPACPDGHGAFLNPATWTVAIPPDGNFKISTPSDQTKVEGGKEADTGTINLEAMICCEVPSANAYFTTLA